METIKPLEIHKVNKLIESKEAEELEECLQRLELKSFSLGQGGNAEVLGIEDHHFTNVCLKKIKEKPQMKANTIDIEHQFQIDAYKAGVRTPLTLISFETDDGKYFIMERVFGITIEELCNKPSLAPKGFDVDVFVEELRLEVRKMNAAGIFHRDLHDRNVMMNEQGKPVIIDFGTATSADPIPMSVEDKYAFASDWVYEESPMIFDNEKGKYMPKTGYFKDDMKESFAQLRTKLAGIRVNLTNYKK